MIINKIHLPPFVDDSNYGCILVDNILFISVSIYCCPRIKYFSHKGTLK